MSLNLLKYYHYDLLLLIFLLELMQVLRDGNIRLGQDYERPRKTQRAHSFGITTLQLDEKQPETRTAWWVNLHELHETYV